MYLLDSNTYIQAKNTYYDMNICPGYWDFLDREFKKHHLASIKPVYNELKQTKSDDEYALSVWVKEHKEHFLLAEDEKTQLNFVSIVEYVDNLEGKNETNKLSFLDAADPWLIAKAMTLKDQG